MRRASIFRSRSKRRAGSFKVVKQKGRALSGEAVVVRAVRYLGSRASPIHRPTYIAPAASPARSALDPVPRTTSAFTALASLRIPRIYSLLYAVTYDALTVIPVVHPFLRHFTYDCLAPPRHPTRAPSVPNPTSGTACFSDCLLHLFAGTASCTGNDSSVSTRSPPNTYSATYLAPELSHSRDTAAAFAGDLLGTRVVCGSLERHTKVLIWSALIAEADEDKKAPIKQTNALMPSSHSLAVGRS